MSLPPPDTVPGHAAQLAARFAAHAAEQGLADVAYATIDGPLGQLLAAATPRGLVRIAYLDNNGGVEQVVDQLAAKLSPRVVWAPARLDAVRRELDEYFEGQRHDFDLALDWALIRSPFTKRVLQATAAIPFGITSTYRDVATDAGSPRGFRAAGNALGSNPIPIVIPCHRVMASAGGFGGYTGGLHRKEALLGLEGVMFSR